MTISDGSITINFGSIIVTYAIFIGLGLLGFRKGFRYMLSIALFITIGYILTVQGGNFIVGLVNRFYQNGPKLAAFAIGRDPSTVAPLDPLIPDNFQSPLLLRVLVFFGLLLVGIIRVWPWEAVLKPSVKPGHPLRILGALTGLYVGILGISAVSSFWAEAPESLNQPNLLTTALSGLPTFAPIIPSVIAAFLILLIIVIILRFSRVWRFESEGDTVVIVTPPKK